MVMATRHGRHTRVAFTTVAAASMLIASACGSGGSNGKVNGGQSQNGANVEKVATYNGSDRHAKLVAGAKREGTLNLSMGPATSIAHDLTSAFKKQYPFVKINLTQGSNSDLARKVQQQQQAGKPEADVLDTSFGGLGALQKAGLLAKFKSPEETGYPSNSYTPYFATSFQSYVGLGYNTKAVKSQDVPKTLDDLLDPKWNGKMAIATSDTAVMWVAMLEMTRGKSFLDKLAKQNISGQDVSGQALENLVVSGEVALSPTIYDSHVHDSQKKGAPIKWQPISPVVANPEGPALVGNAPDPNAAMLWIDFELSKAGQEIYMKDGYDSARKDLSSTGSGTQKFKTIYIDTRSDYTEKYATWHQDLESLIK